MADRRKILIPVGSEPETPHFDAEETLLSARPVVPIAPGDAREDFHYAPAPAARTSFYKRPAFLALVVVAAVCMGLAAGLVIARYRYQPAPMASQPAQPTAPATTAPDTRTATVQPPKEEQPALHPTLPEVKTEEQTTVAEANEDSDKTDEKASNKAPERSAEKKRASDDEDNAKTSQPVTREKKRTSEDNEDADADTAPRAQRRERRTRNRDEDTVDIPRRMERASEQINRIREIFEGRQRP
jgi:type IV secretory pathway VirB10-like protein